MCVITQPDLVGASLRSSSSEFFSLNKLKESRLAKQELLQKRFCIIQCITKAMEHLSDFTFVSMVNVTLCRRDSYLVHVKSGL